MPKQRRFRLDFDYNGDRYRLLPDYFRDPTTNPRGVFTDAEVAASLAITKEFWELFLELGFTSFGVRDDGRTVYQVVFDTTQGQNGFANNGSMTIGHRSPGARGLTAHRGLIVHELFHAVTYAVDDPFQDLKAFREGAADVARFLLLSQAERNTLGLPSYNAYLGEPGATMWDRPSPGSLVAGGSRSSPTLWWLYFVDQLGTRTTEPGAKTDALRDMLRVGWRTAETFEAARTTRRVAGRFLGNGQHQFLFDSNNRSHRFGLVSPCESFGGSGATHSRMSNNERFGAGGWRIRAGDRVVGVGDLVGNGRDQFVIQSRDPMHLGVVGYNQTDGRWFSTLPRTYQSAPVDARWGGWKLRAGDRIHAVGRFATPDREHMVITSVSGSESPHIGVLGLTAEGDKQTAAVIREGGTFGPGGWEYSRSDRIVGRGPILGNGRHQLVIQPRARDTIAIVGLTEGGAPQTYVVVRTDERFGRGWRVKRGDVVLGVGVLAPTGRAHILLRSREGNFGAVGVSASGAAESGPIVAPGQRLGTPTGSWTWREDDEVVGFGDFLRNGRQQFAIHRRGENPQLGVVGIDGGGRFTTTENSAVYRAVSALDEVWAIGDFAGLGNDQIFGRRGKYLNTRSFEEPIVSLGTWRLERFGLDAREGTFTSTHYFLSQYLGEKGASRSFTAFWRDFTVTNRTKDLVGAPAELRYSISLPARAVASEAYPAAVTPYGINRWAARYFDISPAATRRTARLRGRVLSAPFQVYWSVVVVDAGGGFKSVTREQGNAMDTRVALDPGETATLIVTTTFANCRIELDPIA